MAKSRTDDGPDAEVSREENHTAATKEVVDRIREPAPDEGTANVRAGVEQTDQKSVARAVAADAVDLGEEDVGAVDARLIPALDSGTNGAGDDGEVKTPREPPFVSGFLVQGGLLLLVESVLASDVFVVPRVLRDQGALAQQADVLSQALLLSKDLDSAHKLRVGKALEGILDPRFGRNERVSVAISNRLPFGVLANLLGLKVLVQVNMFSV